MGHEKQKPGASKPGGDNNEETRRDETRRDETGKTDARRGHPPASERYDRGASPTRHTRVVKSQDLEAGPGTG